MKSQMFESTLVLQDDSDDSSGATARGPLAAVAAALGRLFGFGRGNGDGRSDHGTSLFNESGLMAHGNELLASSRRDGREVTLAVFDCSDLLEVRQIYGSRTSRKLAACIVKKLSQLAGDRGVAARTGQARFAVAMPMGREKAVEAIARVLGNPSRIELEGSNSEIVLVPNLMVESVPQGNSLDRLYAALCRGLNRIQEEEQLRQQYLKRERERHSRPMPLQAAPVSRPQVTARSMPRLGPDPVVMQQLPPTIPMPLPAR